ncbi:MAG: hypothetical protein QOH14_2173 [Pseudonocardiales bacterium]|jgi:hypothetical protein|nr:hypothetical protein [Pseudonocardiales bacterium]
MITNMTTTMAALPGNSAPSFVVSTGPAAFWHLAADGVAADHVAVHDVPRSAVTPIPTRRRVSDLAAKQDRPPRGIPR